jgi:hypothetical protein
MLLIKEKKESINKMTTSKLSETINCIQFEHYW